MLRSLWSVLWTLAVLLGNSPNPGELPSAESDLGHGMDPDG